MSANEPLDPMDGLAARALAAERAHLPHDAARAERLFSRVLVSVGATAVGVAVGAGAAGTAHAAAAGSSAGAPLAAGASAASKVPLAAVTAKTAAGIAALAFVLGTGTGAALEHARRPAPETAAPAPPASAVPSSPSAPSAVPSTPEPLLASATPPAPSLPVATARGTSSGAAPVAPEASATSTQDAKDAELAAERALVDRARSALGRGDTTASLDAVAAHEARFPRGRLTEERELVAIQALVRRGETGAAKARADRFRRAHPKSVFVPAIDRLAPP